jgi:N-acetyl sugar amidotransferase
VPVSGGKDSHYQVWLLKEKYGMNPLLVTFNHIFNAPSGNYNLRNLVEKSGFDLIRYTAGVDSVRKISKHMLETVGDLTWHYHAGIKTFPFQVAVQYNIPLIVWGEHGFAELTGLVSLEDFVEFTKWTRKEHDMRGLEPNDLIGKGGITNVDIKPYIYPTDEEIARTDVRGIYISNFFPWNAKKHTELMIDKWGFSPVTYERERTFIQYGKIEDHANDVHDYLKYLKFGYGRATDDASMEIRHGRMSRKEGIEMVKKYDAHEPSTLGYYCDFLGITKNEFYNIVNPMRDLTIWNKNKGKWIVKDFIWQHDADMDDQNVGNLTDHAFSEVNKHLYFNLKNPPKRSGVPELDNFPQEFQAI